MNQIKIIELIKYINNNRLNHLILQLIFHQLLNQLKF